jgi:putative Holliday junction resolvase
VGRILAVDYGDRRIGLAISDPTATIATPLRVLVRRPGKRPPVHAIASLATQHDVEHIVIGLPLTLAGDESDRTGEIRSFGTKLAERTGASVSFADERLTSVMAERAVRSLGLRHAQRREKQRIDAAAAVIILQGFLDRMRATGQVQNGDVP